MDGYLQTGIGIAVSIVLFWLSYRQTIGAKKERTKNSNKSLHRAVIRRIVLEDYSPKYQDITRIIEGKAREFNTSVNDMLSEEQVLNSIFTEVFDSDLISPKQRVEIEKRLDTLFTKMEEKPLIPSIREYDLLTLERKKKRDSLAILTVMVSMVGATTSLLYSFIENPTFIVTSNSEWLLSGISVFVASMVAISFMSVIRKEKEKLSFPSKNTAVFSGAAFELEVAKTIEKSGYSYQAENQVGDHGTDFIIEANNKRIAVEAKAWGDSIPLSRIRNTLNRLEALSSERGFDSVYLVTKKSAPFKGFDKKNSNVKVVSMAEFTSILKNKEVA